MDGLKRRLNESIQLKLSVTLCGAILAVAIVAGIFSFLSAFDEAHELQDNVLRQIAQLVQRQGLSAVTAASDIDLQDGDEESRVIVQRLDDGKPSSLGVDKGGPLPLPEALSDGLRTLELGGEAFRVLVRTTASGARFAVAQEAGFRDEIARNGALRSVMPFLILVPVLLLIVADLVRKMFRPMAALSREIDLRAEQDLHPIEAQHLPTEVRPFAVAINRLLARVGLAMESQRRFVADAAHELRSPMTAMSLQAERLAQADMSAPARERLTVLRQGIERGRNLLEQLLTLARAQSSAPSQAESSTSPLSVQHVYRSVMEELMSLAEAKHIDLGIEGTEDAPVWVNELDMMVVVKNLVDNAIRYTPDGGRVDLSVQTSKESTELRIQDNGPGIPAAERDRVFDPFYRLLGSDQLGSGLGLSIVQTIARRIGADIDLAFSDDESQTGLCVTVRIPNARPILRPA